MKLRRRVLCCSIALVLGSGLGDAWSQTVVGPGTVTTTVTSSSGTTSVVGNTTINTSAGSTDGVRANGGDVILDMAAAPGGAIIVQTAGGRALRATVGSISAQNGINIRTTNGAAMFADGGDISVWGGNISATNYGMIAGATAGSVEIGATSAGDPVLAPGAAGAGLGADGSGQLVLESGNRFYLGQAGVFRNVYGIGVQGPAATATVNGALPITFNGNGAMGIYLYGGGQLIANAPIGLTFAGSSSVGLTVDSGSNAQTLNGLAMTFNATAGTGGTGVVLQRVASATLGGLTIAGPGAGLGVWVQEGSSLALAGASRIGIASASKGQSFRFLPGVTSSLATGGIFGSISVPSQKAGALVQGGSLTSTGTTWTNSSQAGYGIYAGMPGTSISSVSLTGDSVTTTGANSTSLQTYTNGQITATNSTVRNEGGMVALYMWNFGDATRQVVADSSIILSNTTVTATGSAYGLYSNNASKGWGNTFTLQGGHLTSERYAIVAAGPLTATATDARISGVQGLLSAGGNGINGEATWVELTANNSILEGFAEADTASTANITLNDRSHWTGQASNLTNVSVDATSLWTITEVSTVSQRVLNNGRIEFTPPTGDVYKHLYTQSYQGGNGSVLALNTYLGEDDSPTDQLILDGGDATGQSELEILNAGGPGALTLGDGIRVIVALNGATTDTGAFTNNQLLLAGPYNYRLYRGGFSTGTEQDWFLRSAVAWEPHVPAAAPAARRRSTCRSGRAARSS